jgi:hypothetical protein
LTAFIASLIAVSRRPAIAGSMSLSAAALVVGAEAPDEGDDDGSPVQPVISSADAATAAHHRRFGVI